MTFSRKPKEEAICAMRCFGAQTVGYYSELNGPFGGMPIVTGRFGIIRKRGRLLKSGLRSLRTLGGFFVAVQVCVACRLEHVCFA